MENVLTLDGHTEWQNAKSDNYRPKNSRRDHTTFELAEKEEKQSGRRNQAAKIFPTYAKQQEEGG